MNPRIGVLAPAGFALATEAFVFIGHLDAMAATRDVPVAAVGQRARVFAFSSACSAPFVAAAVDGVERRRVLVMGLGAIGAVNLLAAMPSTLGGLITVRLLCGLATGQVGRIAIRWNEHMVPWIGAGADEDFAYALGLVHGHLRAGQIMILRGTARGGLAERLGQAGPMAIAART